MINATAALSSDMSALKGDKSQKEQRCGPQRVRERYFRDTSHYPIAIRTIAGTTATICNTFSLAETTCFAREIEEEGESERTRLGQLAFLSPRDNRVALSPPDVCKCVRTLCARITFKYNLVRFPSGERGGAGGMRERR